MEIIRNSNKTTRLIKKTIPYLFFISIFISCQKEDKVNSLNTGIWRGEIIAQNHSIPFNFNIQKNKDAYKIDLINGDETLEIEGVKVIGDSIFFDMHIFDISIKAKITDSLLTGIYTKNYAENYILPFRAKYNKKGRFDEEHISKDFDGTWETIFKTKEGKENEAIGIFKTENNQLKGTFLSATGDYRYLNGYVKNDTMHLYSFDGNHIYKLKAVRENDSLLKGEFWSGKTGYNTFISKKNAHAKLPNANELTYLKEGYDDIAFTFPGLDGKPVSLNDEKYQNKVVILQVLGTWCPNCMDETKFYKAWYDQNKDQDVEILGLAYEVKSDFAYAKKRVLTMKEKLDVDYDFVIAGTSTTKSASESLPMLNKVMSFPTSIILDKKGKVRRIHTGFSGPATGIYYEKYVEEFNNLMNELLQE